jgi:cobalt/nickel transport system ATP-binding protein
MSEPLVSLHDVDFGYDALRPVLRRCSFRLQPGQRIALRGANGSGKTTLLHLIVGLLRPSAGRVEVFGQPRAAERDFHEVRRRVGLLFQDADDQLFCPTVAEDVAFGPLNLGLPRDRVRQVVAETLASVGLAGYEHRITYKLSGGEKRLVALATVLAMQPEVLLLDEPASGLDEQATERLAELLNRLPHAMLVVSHQQEFCRRVTSGTLTLVDGRIVWPEGDAGGAV